MVDLLLYVLLFALLVLAVLAGLWVMRNSLGGQTPMTALFGPRAEKRLGVVEHVGVDGRRRLVLIRRDNVEHLIMTGGPVDVLIETGIPPVQGEAAALPRAPTAEAAEHREPVFGRQNNSARNAQPAVE